VTADADAHANRHVVGGHVRKRQALAADFEHRVLAGGVIDEVISVVDRDHTCKRPLCGHRLT
jgi:hypothetical protein